MSKDNNDFPKVGVDQSTLPEDLNASLDAKNKDEDSAWWPSINPKTKKDIPGPNDNSEDNKKIWKSTASDEMESFRPVPVVGRFPWRTQYLVFTLILLASLGGILFFSLSGNSSSSAELSIEAKRAVAMNNSLSALYEDLKKVSQGQPAPSLAQNLNNTSANASVLDDANRQSWEELKSLVIPIAQSAQDTVALSSSAVEARDAIAAGLNAAAPLWRDAGNNGEWTSVEAVNFAQAYSELRYIYETLDNLIQDQTSIPNRFSTSRQNIDQAIRVFASSDISQTNSSLTQSWRALASGFVNARPHLDNIIGRQEAWNNAQNAVEVFDNRYSSLSSSLVNRATLSVTQNSSGFSSGFWVSIAFAIISLAFLVWIGWKQQRWHILETKSVNEQMEFGIIDLKNQFQKVSAGDLTVKIVPSIDILKPLGLTLNKSLKSIKNLIRGIKDTTQSTTNAASSATQATGELVDITRAHLNDLLENGQDILAITSAVQNVSDISQEASSVANETIEAVQVGQDAVSDARERIQNIRDKAEEGTSRSHRLRQSSSEILFASTLLNEVAEQMSVLSIQAALQAAKAGSSGEGFRVVADGLKALAEKSGEGARRVGSLIEANIADVQAMEEAMELVTKETDEGSRLSDISLESTLAVNARVEQLQELINKILEISTQQGESASQLSARTQNGLKNIENSSQKAQHAAEAVVVLVDNVRALEQSALQFKV